MEKRKKTFKVSRFVKRLCKRFKLSGKKYVEKIVDALIDYFSRTIKKTVSLLHFKLMKTELKMKKKIKYYYLLLNA